MKLSKNDMVNYGAILVIVVSLASIGMQLTGFATVQDTGIVNVTIDSAAAINFTIAFIDFGNGTVDAGPAGATLDTEGTVTDGNWDTVSANLTLENIGNENVSLNFSSDEDADTYLGGTNPTFKYKVTADESGACVDNTASSYIDMNTTSTEVCTTFPFADAMDQISIDIELYIPSDSFTGEQTATITATGTYGV
ncbi:hypothetical protein KAS08_00875 [Candidatus Pacearchaeota archaeon]|nr:hypothetical protein [Candidatus Pacearchaeota archaeon]